MSTIVYAARRIVTMNPNQPFATHVAVRDGRILGAGTLESLRGWGKFDLDERFADKVILPGFVEGHSHAFEGGVWKFPYVGFFDRTSPDGKRSPGLKNIEEVVAALQAHEKTMPKDGSTLFAWGFDPIYFTGRRMNLGDLDKVSTERPVIVLHSNFHVLNANTPVFAKAKITRHTNVHGIVKDEAGEPTGELQENTAKYLAYKAAGIDLSDACCRDEPATWGFARVAQLAGVTTATDLHNTLPDSTVEAYLQASGSADFPLRLLPAFAAHRDAARRRASRGSRVADEEEQRQAALRPGEDRHRRLDPGPVGAHALARLLRRHAQRRLEHRRRTSSRQRSARLPPRRLPGAHPHQRRRGDRARDRIGRARARRGAALGPSPHPAALPDGRRRRSSAA